MPDPIRSSRETSGGDRVCHQGKWRGHQTAPPLRLRGFPRERLLVYLWFCKGSRDLMECGDTCTSANAKGSRNCDRGLASLALQV